MSYTVKTAEKIIFEEGGIKKLSDIIAGSGKRAFLMLSGSFVKGEFFSDLIGGLKRCGVEYEMGEWVVSEPSPEDVDKNAEKARDFHADLIVAVGGGSVLDTGKAVAAMVTNKGGVEDYLEGIGTKTLLNDPVPFIAVPTTAGTGAEVTKNAVITSKEKGYKKSIRHEKMFATVALVDPLLTIHLPFSVTASSGMDALCQLIEGYTTREPNAFCEALALYHIPRAFQALHTILEQPEDISARTAMCEAANASGMIIACSGLGAAHGIAAGLGAKMDISHGIACAILLPHIMRYNHAAGVEKYADIALSCGVKDIAALIAKVEKLNDAFHIPSDLKGFKIKPEDLDGLAAACIGNSLRRNPVDMTAADVRGVLKTLI